MAGHGKTKKIIRDLFIVLSILLACFAFFPFTKMSQIDTGYGDAENYNGVDYVLSIIEDNMIRIPRYYHMAFLTKGATYKNIPFHPLDDEKHIQYINLHFNWDNSVDIDNGKKIYKMNVKCVELERHSALVDSIDSYGNDIFPTNPDSMFMFIRFLEHGTGDTLMVFRQKKLLLLGRQRLAWMWSHGGKCLITGTPSSHFDY